MQWKFFFMFWVGLPWLTARHPPSCSGAFPSSTGHGEKTRWKSSWIEIKTGSTLSDYHHRQNRLEDINLLPVKLNRNKTQNAFPFPAYHTFPCSQLLSSSASSLIWHGLSTGCRGISAPDPGSPPPSFSSTHVGVCRVVSNFFLFFFLPVF